MADIPGAPTPITFGSGDCAEEKILEFMQYQDQWNQAICSTLSLLTGGGSTIETIREKHSVNTSGADVTFVDVLSPLTTNCCVIINGAVCIPEDSDSNGTQIDENRVFNYATSIKCDGQIVFTKTTQQQVFIPAGGFAVIPKHTVFISSNLQVSALGKTPNPGDLTVCTSINGGPDVVQDVTLTSLVVCSVSLS